MVLLAPSFPPLFQVLFLGGGGAAGDLEGGDSPVPFQATSFPDTQKYTTKSRNNNKIPAQWLLGFASTYLNMKAVFIGYKKILENVFNYNCP
jgi:hypothetical protein